MTKWKWIGLVLILITAQHSLISQSLPTGIPPIRNFTKKAYKGAPQNWDIHQSSNQTMLFANNLGLIQYDGTYWSQNEIGNKTIVRSVLYLDNGLIMVGGQGDIGYFNTGENGVLNYHSIVDFIPDQFKQFEDVWNIEASGDTIFFNTTRELFVWKNDSVSVFTFEKNIDILIKVEQSIYMYVASDGFYKMKNGKPVKTAMNIDIPTPISGIVQLSEDTLLISTEKDGLFYWINSTIKQNNNKYLSPITSNWVNQMVKLNDGKIAFGTAQNGVFILDFKQKQAININASIGLQNNNVLSLYQDVAGDIWVATENGLDLIQYHSPYRAIYPDGNLKGAGYTAALHNNELYLGTTNGLFKFDKTGLTDEFSYVNNSKGQVWRLDTIDGNLYMGHHSGAFYIKALEAYPAFTQTGVWKFLTHNDSLILFGSYEGLGVLNKLNGQNKLLTGFKESSRIITKDTSGQLWISHPYRGVYKINLTSDVSKVEADKMNLNDGLFDNPNSYVFLINKRPYVCSENGVYRYNYNKDYFEKDTILENQIDPVDRVKLLYEDKQNNIWYHTLDDIGVLEIKDHGLNKEVNRRVLPQPPEKLIGGFELIMQITHDIYLLGCEQGFVLFNKKDLNTSIKYNTIIHKATLPNEKDSIIFLGLYTHNELNHSLQLPKGQNSIRLCFSSTSFGEELTEFRYHLKGLNDQFSEWSTNSEVQFNNLKYGDYTISVESRVAGKKQDHTSRLAFTIPTPWFRTTFAQVMLTIATLGIILLFFYLQKMKFESEKEYLENVHKQKVEEKDLQVEKTEEELTQIKNEKLQSEIEHKNNELASSTMHLLQKQELLASVQQSLKKAIKKDKFTPEQKQELNLIIQMLKQDAIIDDDWEKFSQYFDEVHGNFTQKLKEKHPVLTNYDLKLCAYLRMNLTTKDIAALMNVSPRAIEGSRYRLRKKLDLKTEINLVDFMQNI